MITLNKPTTTDTARPAPGAPLLQVTGLRTGYDRIPVVFGIRF